MIVFASIGMGRRVMVVVFSFALCGVWLVLSAAGAEQPPARGGTQTAAPPGTAAPWTLESLTLKSGAVYQGFVQTESRAEIEFVEIRRPPGKPMYAVVRPVDPRTVDRLVRLSGGERARLLEQFATFRNRTRIEAGRMDAVSLQRETRDGQACWLHTGDWWQLESSADEEMTRRCVVRIEQMFRAYRQLFPPHREHATTLHIRLYGASDEYQAALQQENLGVENPALYLASRNTVLAGSDLNAYSRRLVQVREQNALTRRQYTQLNAAFPSRMAALGDDLRRKGYTAEEVVQETKLHTATWKREYEAALARIHRAEQQNHARFAEVTALMFQRLYH